MLALYALETVADELLRALRDRGIAFSNEQLQLLHALDVG